MLIEVLEIVLTSTLWERYVGTIPITYLLNQLLLVEATISTQNNFIKVPFCTYQSFKTNIKTFYTRNAY